MLFAILKEVERQMEKINEGGHAGAFYFSKFCFFSFHTTTRLLICCEGDEHAATLPTIAGIPNFVPFHHLSYKTSKVPNGDPSFTDENVWQVKVRLVIGRDLPTPPIDYCSPAQIFPLLLLLPRNLYFLAICQPSVTMNTIFPFWLYLYFGCCPPFRGNLILSYSNCFAYFIVFQVNLILLF